MIAYSIPTGADQEFLMGGVLMDVAVCDHGAGCAKRTSARPKAELGVGARGGQPLPPRGPGLLFGCLTEAKNDYQRKEYSTRYQRLFIRE